jgi:hypothetical protein
VAQINAEALLAKLAQSQKPKEPAAPPPEPPVDLRQFQNVMDQGNAVEGGIADLVKRLAPPQKLLSQRSPVQYMGAPEPQLLLPPPAAGRPAPPPAALPQLPAPPRAAPAPVAPPPVAPATPVVARAPRAPVQPPDDPFAIPAFLDRAAPKKVTKAAPEAPPLQKATAEAPKAPVKKMQDAAEDWVIEHDKADLSPYDAANAIADQMEKAGKPFRVGRSSVVGYVSRILKDKSEAASNVAKAAGIDELKLRKTLWGLKDRDAALAKIDQLSRLYPKHEDLIRSTLEPKVTKWWKK